MIVISTRSNQENLVVKMASHLLILNYCMDEDDPVFSQQTQVVSKLLEHYTKITVITGRVGIYKEQVNLQVINTNWKTGKSFSNALNFLIRALPVVIINRPSAIFSHMTEVQSFLISPFSKILRIKHFLWYAHASKTFYLVWNHLLLTGIVTSTFGSCPISGPKVKIIGQAVDEKLFKLKHVASSNLNKLIHVGRFDKSKNIELIIKEVLVLRSEFPDLTLTLVGSPSNANEFEYSSNTIKKYESLVHEGWLTFRSSIPRRDIPELFFNFDIFVHSYQGSLDKTLIEATLSGLPVVTLNFEYIKDFGNWCKPKQTKASHSQQIKCLFEMERYQVDNELKRRREFAIEKHSLDNWIFKLMRIIE